MNSIKYVLFGLKRKWRESENFRFGCSIYGSLMTIVPVGAWLFLNTDVGANAGIFGKIFFGALAGILFWFVFLFSLAMLFGFCEKALEITKDLINEGKKEEARVFRILKGEEDGRE